MNVHEIKAGMTCSILSVKKGSKYESESVICGVEGSSVITEATVLNGAIVNRSGTDNFLIIHVENSKPQTFAHVSPEIIRRDGKSFYRIHLGGKQSITYNRRHNSRVYIGKGVHVRADDRADTCYCMLKDISAVGFALVFAESDLPKDYKNIRRFSLIYRDDDRLHDIHTTFELDGVVKRIVDDGGGKKLFGCQIKFSPRVDMYVSKKMSIAKKNKSIRE